MAFSRSSDAPFSLFIISTTVFLSCLREHHQMRLIEHVAGIVMIWFGPGRPGANIRQQFFFQSDTGCPIPPVFWVFLLSQWNNSKTFLWYALPFDKSWTQPPAMPRKKENAALQYLIKNLHIGELDVAFPAANPLWKEHQVKKLMINILGFQIII